VDNEFSPANIQVAPGTSVTFTWGTNASAHNVTFGDGVASSQLQGTGASYSRTFNTAGTFSYTCTLHGGMNGSVLVKQ
jgi:plastocyanin